MTIKEIEELSGMTRANIRFYEAEGLLAPARSQNGYRDYSEEDLEILKRVRLLRTLRVSLEDIKALQEGTEELTPLLNRHISKLEAEQVSIGQSKEVCREICRDGAEFQALNAQRYLDALNRFPEADSEVPGTDMIPPIRAPFRRLMARLLDWALYSTIWDCVLMLVFRVNLDTRSVGWQFIDFVAVLVMMYLVESVMLVTVGATPGKWILGLGVTDIVSEGRLSWEKATARTWEMLWDGMGFNIAGYRLYRFWKSYQACENGETLSWEYSSNLTLRDEKGWRWAAWGVTFGLTVLATFFSVADVQSPRYGGDITIAQFSENFNYLADYYGIDFKSELNEAGEWVEIPQASNMAVIYVGGKVDTPDFVFAQENGFVKSVSFRQEIGADEDIFMAPSCQNQMILAALAFAGGEKGFGAFSDSRGRIAEEIEAHAFEDFAFSENGFALECDVEYIGYIGGSGAGVLFADEDAPDRSYSLEFTMTKEQLQK